jgi:hypothetical protein
VTGYFERVIEPLGSVRGYEFLDQLLEKKFSPRSFFVMEMLLF